MEADPTPDEPLDVYKTQEYLMAYRKRLVVTKPMRTRRSRKFNPEQHRSTQIGTASELMVAAYLLRSGWHVYRCLARTGPIDLIAYRDGMTIYIEVKTGNASMTECQSPVTHLAIYNPETGEVAIKEVVRPSC